MASEWSLIPLSDLTDPDTPITYGVVKPGTKDLNGVLFIRSGDIVDGRIMINQLRTISHDVSEQYKRTLLRGGEILVSLVGNPGQVAIVPKSLKGANIARQVGLIRLQDGIDNRFVKYYLMSPSGQESLGAHSLGSVQEVINLGDLKTISIPIPHISEQHAIAHILGTLDEKIELNRRMNETLEATARAIFKSWFVDFDPVYAKMEDRDPGLPPQIADLFPNHLVDSELGEIPAGWEVMELQDVADVVDCLHAKKPQQQDEGPLLLQVYNVGEVGEIDLSVPYHITKDDYIKWIRRFEASPGDIVITKTGRVGAIAQIPKGFSAALGRNLVGIRAKEEILTSSFLRDCMLSNSFDREIRFRTSQGTILESLHVKNISILRIILPGNFLIEAYDQLICPLHNKIEINNIQSRTLGDLRETLLPKLISGELRMGDPVAFLESVS